MIKVTAYTNPETVVVNALRDLSATTTEDGWKVVLRFRDEAEMKALQDAHNLTQVGKCCLYMDNMLDLAHQATTYTEGLFWLYLRKSDLDGMVKVVKLMQVEYKDELK